MNQEKIGKFILECRKKQNMTQEELAEKLNVSAKSISRWENGRCMPDLSLLKPLSNELNIELNDLLNGEIQNNKNYDENIINLSKHIERKYRKKLFRNIIIFILLILLSVSVFRRLYTNIRFPYKYNDITNEIVEVDGQLWYQSNKIDSVDYTIKHIDGENIVFFNNGYTLESKITRNKYDTTGEAHSLNRAKEYEHMKIYYVDINIEKVDKMSDTELKNLIKKSNLLFER